MAGVGNDLYTPSCATACSDNLLAAVGDTDCANEENIELAEINEIFLDEKSATAYTPKNPVATYTEGSDNSAGLLTWINAVNNSTASKVRRLFGIGEKPNTETTNITLHRGKNYATGTRHRLIFNVTVIDNDTYNFIRKLQACRGQYHLWFSTDSYFYGADNGTLADIEDVQLPKTGGRGQASQAIITLGWNAKADPVRDRRVW